MKPTNQNNLTRQNNFTPFPKRMKPTKQNNFTPFPKRMKQMKPTKQNNLTK